MINVKLIKKTTGSRNRIHNSVGSGSGTDLSSLNGILDHKLDTAILESAFVPVREDLTEMTWKEAYGSEDFFAIKAKKGFFSMDFVSAMGINPDSGGGAGSSLLSELNDVLLGNLEDGQSLVYDAVQKKWINKRIEGTGGTGGIDADELERILSGKNYALKSDIPSLTGYATEQWVKNQGYLTSSSLNGYATQQWVRDQNYLTKHQDIFTLTLNPGKFSGGTYNPKNSAQTFNIPTQTSHLTNDSDFTTNALLNAGLKEKLDKTEFEKLFKKVTLSDGTTAIEAQYGFYSLGFVSAKGANNNAGNGGEILNFVTKGTGNGVASVTKSGTTVTVEMGSFLTSQSLDGYLTKTEANGLFQPKGNYLTSVSWNDVIGKPSWIKSTAPSFTDLSSHPTTLSGYGITDGITATTANASFVTALGTNGNFLTWTKNGAVNNITVPYAINADTLDGVHEGGMMRYLSNFLTIDNENLYRGCGYVNSASSSTPAMAGTGGAIGFGAPAYFKLLNGWYNSNTLYLNTYNNGTWLGWREFAFTDSNVASASKLQTAKKIWGQTFDGTEDVTGVITDCTGVYLSENDSAFTPENMFGCYIWDNVVQFSRRTLNNAYISNIMTMDLASGRVGFNNDPSSSYQVYVNGTMGVTGAVSLASLLNVSGAASLSSSLSVGGASTLTGLLTANGGIIVPYTQSIKIGECEISWDGSGLKFSKGIYSLEWVSAKGKNDEAGGGSFGQYLTLQRNGVKIGEYNGSAAQTINISVPTNTNELTNGAGFITGSALNGYATQDWVRGLGYANTSQLNNYLPLSGGTLTGILTLDINSANSAIHFSRAGASYIMATAEGGTLNFIAGSSGHLSANSSLSISASTLYPGTTDAISLGASSYRWKGLYSVLGNFSGQITSTVATGTSPFSVSSTTLNTNLNADLLDGVHETGFMRRYSSTLSATSDVTNLYRSCGYALNSNEELSTPSNGPFIGFGNETYYKVLWGAYGSNTLRLRTNTNGAWSDWREFAFTDSNVASATRLQASQNIWGQPFNGTSPVSGNMTGVGSISATGTIYSTKNGYAFYWGSDNQYFLGSNINSDFYLWASANSSLRIGTNNAERIRVTGDGNTGFGTTSPSYKVHIAGTLFASDAVSFGSSLEVSGITTTRNIEPYGDYNYILGTSAKRWSAIYGHTAYLSEMLSIGNSTYGVLDIGGARIEWDNVNKCLKINTGFYSESFISAKGVNSGTGGVAEGSYLPLAGGTIAGDLTINGNITSKGDVILGALSSDHVQLIGNDIFLNADWSLTLSAKEYVYINGMVGIGTPNPSESLHTNGNIRGQGFFLEECDAKFTPLNMFGMYVWDNVLSFTRRTLANAWTANILNINLANGRIGFNANPNNSYQVYISGTLGVSGAVSQNTSDLRLKTDIDTDIDCLTILLKLGNVFTFRYNGLAVRDRSWLDTGTLHYGFAYQNAVRAGIPGFAGLDEYGYGYLNFLSSDMIALVTGAILQIGIEQRAMKNDMNWLKNEVIELRKENQDLKQRVAKLERA